MNLPFVISLPHCASAVPPELTGRLALGDEAVDESSDHGTSEVFGELPVMVTLPARWSRLVVDLNRAVHQRGPRGVVASRDYFGRPVFLEGQAPSGDEVDQLITRYHLPFHRELARVLDRPEVKGFFDCHSLDGVGPAESPDPGRKRADVTLGNNGIAGGGPDPSRPEGLSCSPRFLALVREAFESQGFSVAVNAPYPGGFITRHYGPALASRGVGALQIELNKRLVLVPPFWRVDTAKARTVRQRVARVFEQVARAL